MEITEIKIFKAKKKGVLLAFANVVFDKKFIIRGIALIETKKGRFISMPSRKLKNQERAYRDVCHPLNAETRTELTKLIFEAYDEFMKAEAKTE